jgi:flagellar biosynthesis protein FlhF
MRLKFFDADNQYDAAFLAAGALGPMAMMVGDSANADGHFASILGEDEEVPAFDTAAMVEAVLYHHDAPSDLIHRVIAGRRSQPDPRGMLATGLRATLKFARLPRADRTRLMLIGPPAAGKTTLMGKLATRGGAPTATVFSTDWERPGGLEQLADSMSILGIDTARLDPDAPMPALGRPGPLLVDTTGTDPGDRGDFVRLGRLAAILAVEPVLVLPAFIDADQAQAFARASIAIGARKLLVTRLDMARRLGGPLAAAHAGLAVAGGSVSPNFAYGLKSLSPASLAAHLVDLADRHLAGGNAR